MILSTHGVLASQIQSYAFLLDLYPSAAASYSLRKLRSAYTGSAIRVRRSSDNTEQDIGFTGANVLDTSALTSFCGAGNGFVTTWYDQSGNGRNATQSTAANQPAIFSAGSLITENNKPTIYWDGSDSLSTTQNTDVTTNFSFFSVYSGSSSGASLERGIIKINTFSSGLWIERSTYAGDNSVVLYVANASVSGSPNELPITGFSYKLNSIVRSQNNFLRGYLNSSQNINATTGGVVTNTITNSSLILGLSQQNWLGNIGEIILYSSEQSSNRTGIESNINTYYGIY